MVGPRWLRRGIVVQNTLGAGRPGISATALVNLGESGCEGALFLITKDLE
jgi:hypothetical protein